MNNSATHDFVKLLNTAIIKTKEKNICSNFDSRLSESFKSKAIDSISFATDFLSDSTGVTKDQSTIQLIEAVRLLDTIWNEFLIQEGLNSLQHSLKESL